MSDRTCTVFVPQAVRAPTMRSQFVFDVPLEQLHIEENAYGQPIAVWDVPMLTHPDPETADLTISLQVCNLDAFS